ncbi:hypothetical protein [Rhodococcoides fascians]|uniref:hypothetical protein n=1 Tax=Rhodococcoides fascians TaxID=1828 RepID=UPI0005693A99|nr:MULTISPECIES: hypothetical protein [Rhodococcus]OZC50521.1 hypothetical protein CH289_15965 [Rhodococcus sp. RS1C4]OZD65148.1 hypothetical protein CH263_13475 [Rhodococcus sp. 06-1059B-a]
MATPRVQLNRAVVGEILKWPSVAALVNQTARSIAGAIEDVDEDDIEVQEYSTDRSAASVWVPAEAQARDGALTRAAARVGLEVRQR